MADIGISLNQLEARLSALEQSAMRPLSGQAQVTTADLNAPASEITSEIDWAPAANLWESYTTFGPPISNIYDPNYPGNVISTVYGMPETHLIGSMCLLTGMVRRKTGAANLTANTRYDQPMFGLPAGWRPRDNVILPCIMGNANPDPAASPGPPANTFGTAWIEIRPESAPPQHASGWVYFVMGTMALTAGTGWISLQGIFPCSILQTDGTVQGGWNDVPSTASWNSMNENVTWSTYPVGVTPP
jgi:hypothetical protein